MTVENVEEVVEEVVEVVEADAVTKEESAEKVEVKEEVERAEGSVISSLDDLKAKASEVLSPTEIKEEVEVVAEKTEVVEAKEEAVFEPNLTYKVRDEEIKMDDWVKDKISSEADQKMFQELYTRGHGLELAKTERNEYKEKLETLDYNLNYLTDAVKKGDVQGFITSLGLPKEAFIRYAIDELKYQELPAEQKASIDQQRLYEQNQRDLESRYQQSQSDLVESRNSGMNLEIDREINSDQYNTIAQSYDARVGRPEAFKQLVKERGIFHESVHDRRLTVKEAIDDAIGLIGEVPVGTQANLSQETTSVGTRVVQQQQLKKPVLPNLQGQGTSPTKKIPKSIADLKHRYKELTAQL